MKNKGIDQFRVIAAMMVVAIHCLPLHYLWPEGDILITLTIFRVAVPFFFMISGYYVFAELAVANSYPSRQRVFNFIKKQLKVYLLATLMFLPLALYSQTIGFDLPVGTLAQALLVNGILYHLWYFPALITGSLLLTSLLIHVSFKKVFWLAAGLYLIGLGGDSWFGLIQQTPIEPFYTAVFHLLDGTRNGIFFTPLFLCLGVLVRKQSEKRSLSKTALFFLISLIGLLIESAYLHGFSIPKHDSMYLFLPVVLFFLFPLILRWHPHRTWKHPGQLSLWLYLLHPYTIAGTHFLSQKISILQNNLINYLVVLILTIGFICLFLRQKHSWFRHKQTTPVKRAVKEFSKTALLHNLQEIQRIISPKTKVMAVVKADAYGCGAKEVAPVLEQAGIDFFAVATIDEGIRLRKNAVKSPILVLGYTSPKRIKELRRYSLTQSIISEGHAVALSQRKVAIDCHLAIDTGMHRLGVTPTIDSILSIFDLPFLTISGVYSHLGSADRLNPDSMIRTQKQIACFDQILLELDQRQISYGITHLQSSYGILNYPDLNYDYVRPGILLTGSLSDTNEPTKQRVSLQPILTLKAQLITKRVVAKGEAIGYGQTAVANQETTVGVVSIGYCDGLPRSLSNQEFCLSYRGQSLPQIGLICMDMLLIDLSHCPTIPIESEIEILTDWSDTAEQVQTITNELICRIGPRVSARIK
ncbi:membrane-bound serine racemase VanT [Enterococcus gallinarum]|uniref:membrane-bound serine racemase VanT n=1 Tax=Enterococcus gallinarum TaxID=1353 RepID=UPI0032E3956A